MPYLTEFCLFAAGFLAAYVYGDAIVARLRRSRFIKGQRRRRK